MGFSIPNPFDGGGGSRGISGIDKSSQRQYSTFSPDFDSNTGELTVSNSEVGSISYSGVAGLTTMGDGDITVTTTDYNSVEKALNNNLLAMQAALGTAESSTNNAFDISKAALSQIDKATAGIFDAFQNQEMNETEQTLDVIKFGLITAAVVGSIYILAKWGKK